MRYVFIFYVLPALLLSLAIMNCREGVRKQASETPHGVEGILPVLFLFTVIPIVNIYMVIKHVRFSFRKGVTLRKTVPD